MDVPNIYMICDRHSAPDTLAKERVNIEHGMLGRQNPHVYQRFDSLLDILWVWLEPRCQLTGDLVDKIVVGHLLSVLHHLDDASLKRDCNQIAILM